MGLFKSIKKAFKKVTRGIKKVVKGVVKGVKKVVKKISSSKILKALAIAAAVVVTGGAAIGAFTGGAGVTAGTFGSNFANWMMKTSAKAVGGTLFTGGGALATAGNFVTSLAAKPFAAIGSTLGSAAAKVTDFTGLTTEASRMGVTPEMQTAMAEAQVKAGVQLSPDNLNLEQSIQRVSDAGGGSVADIKSAIDSGLTTKEAIIQQASITTTPTTLLGQEQAAMAAAKSAGASPETMAYLRQQGAQTASAYGAPSADIVSAGFPEAKAMDTWSQRNPNTAKFLTNVGTGVATSVATGYAMQQIAGDPEETGSMAGLRTEGASSFDPLRVYAAERGIADSDISKYFTFGNTAEAGNMPLFQQQTIGVA